MDSITQMVLGAAVAAAVVPAQQRRRALIYGAMLGTVPDLDVLVRYADPVDNMTWHRSYSHSLLLLPPLALVLWWLAKRLDGAIAVAPGRWLGAFLLALVTHPLLDAFTIYGTQLWWPLDPTPVGLGSIFIIDPLYTLPLMGAVLWLGWRARSPAAGRRALTAGLAVSSGYLLWSVLAQQYVLDRALADTQRPTEASASLMATPAPLTTLLWRVVQRQPGSYDEAYMSLWVDPFPTPWVRHASRDELGPALAGHPPYERMVWFTHGFYGLQTEADQVILRDLRMGSEPVYVFSFAIAQTGDDGLRTAPAVQLDQAQPRSVMFSWLAERLFSPGSCLETPDRMLAAKPTPSPIGSCGR